MLFRRPIQSLELYAPAKVVITRRWNQRLCSRRQTCAPAETHEAASLGPALPPLHREGCGTSHSALTVVDEILKARHFDFGQDILISGKEIWPYK